MFWQNLHEIDQHITLFINSLHCGFTDPIMLFFSQVRIWFPMYAIIAGIMFWRLGWKKAIPVVLSCVLCVVICDQTANFFKEWVARLRPCQDQEMIGMGLYMLETGGGLYGFFSGHASNAFGFAVCSSMGLRNDNRQKYRGYSAWIFFWASMVSISRIFVGKHYFGDVITGIIAGTIAGLFCGWLARFVIRRFIKRA